ncbi:MAG: TRAP transporter substrate-binding protein DctP [Candidatus Aminicenantes bacterium]
MKSSSLIMCFVCILFLSVLGNTSDQKPIRLGTLATEESDWGNSLKAMNAELIKESEGQIKLALTFSMDEERLIDLMRKGQFDAVSVTGMGLGWVLGELFIFELPMLFSSYEELDYVRRKLTPEFSRRFENINYVLLGWGDLGFTYLFSKQPIRTQSDLKKTRFWVSNLDPVAEAFAIESGEKPTLASVSNVLSMLEQDEIDTVYGPPYGCLALQWYTHLNYMSDLILAPGFAATIINKRKFDTISLSERNLFKRISEKHHRLNREIIRKRNEESIDVLKNEGIEIIPIPLKEKQKWHSVALRVQNQLAAQGRFFDRELLDRVRQLLEEFHEDKRQPQPQEFFGRKP